jgi:hypothetical protein
VAKAVGESVWMLLQQPVSVVGTGWHLAMGLMAQVLYRRSRGVESMLPPALSPKAMPPRSSLIPDSCKARPICVSGNSARSLATRPSPCNAFCSHVLAQPKVVLIPQRFVEVPDVQVMVGSF